MAAQFEECREKITEMPDIIKDLCRVLYHKVKRVSIGHHLREFGLSYLFCDLGFQ